MEALVFHQRKTAPSGMEAIVLYLIGAAEDLAAEHGIGELELSVLLKLQGGLYRLFRGGIRIGPQLRPCGFVRRTAGEEKRGCQQEEGEIGLLHHNTS